LPGIARLASVTRYSILQPFDTSILTFTDTTLQTYKPRILSHLYPPKPDGTGLG
jgi:hypothetical protein